MTVRRHWDPEHPLTLEAGDVVYVQSDPNEAPKNSDDANPADSNFWIAKVLECRAINNQKVFLRVFWLYRPEDLPMGRQPYHGVDEVIPSNHMQIIDALTVDGRVGDIQHFDEDDDEGVRTRIHGHLWRQTFDCRTGKLSELRQYCRCKRYANPDSALIQCSNGQCRKWMHEDCILEDAVARTYEKMSLESVENETSSEKLDSEAKNEHGDSTAAKRIVGKLTSVTKALLGSRKGKASTPSAVETSLKDISSRSAANPVESDVESIASESAAVPSTAKPRGRPPKPKAPLPSTPVSVVKSAKSAGSAIPAKQWSRPSKTKLLVPETLISPSDMDLENVEITSEKASKHFSAKVVSNRDSKDSGEAASEDKIVEDEDLEIEITDLRDGKGGAQWRESIKCFFCTKEVN